MLDQCDVLGTDIVGNVDLNSIETIFLGEGGADKEQRIRAAADVKNPSMVPVGTNQLVGLTGPFPCEKTFEEAMPPSDVCHCWGPILIDALRSAPSRRGL